MAGSKAPGLRADARRNREALVAAARAVFSQEGLNAPLDAVARRAGVGRGTLYRHFPRREDLIEAIHEQNLDRLERVALEADPPEAFFDLLNETARTLGADRGFSELLRRASAGAGRRAARRFLRIAQEPLWSAQEAGRVRSDLSAADVLLLLDMLGGAVLGSSRPGQHARERRALELIRDGVAPTPRASAGPPDPLRR